MSFYNLCKFIHEYNGAKIAYKQLDTKGGSLKTRSIRLEDAKNPKLLKAFEDVGEFICMEYDTMASSYIRNKLIMESPITFSGVCTPRTEKLLLIPTQFKGRFSTMVLRSQSECPNMELDKMCDMKAKYFRHCNKVTYFVGNTQRPNIDSKILGKIKIVYSVLTLSDALNLVTQGFKTFIPYSVPEAFYKNAQSILKCKDSEIIHLDKTVDEDGVIQILFNKNHHLIAFYDLVFYLIQWYESMIESLDKTDPDVFEHQKKLTFVSWAYFMSAFLESSVSYVKKSKKTRPSGKSLYKDIYDNVMESDLRERLIKEVLTPKKTSTLIEGNNGHKLEVDSFKRDVKTVLHKKKKLLGRQDANKEDDMASDSESDDSDDSDDSDNSSDSSDSEESMDESSKESGSRTAKNLTVSLEEPRNIEYVYDSNEEETDEGSARNITQTSKGIQIYTNHINPTMKNYYCGNNRQGDLEEMSFSIDFETVNAACSQHLYFKGFHLKPTRYTSPLSSVKLTTNRRKEIGISDQFYNDLLKYSSKEEDSYDLYIEYNYTRFNKVRFSVHQVTKDRQQDKYLDHMFMYIDKLCPLSRYENKDYYTYGSEIPTRVLYHSGALSHRIRMMGNEVLNELLSKRNQAESVIYSGTDAGFYYIN